jgi:peptidoglycan hydrolase-like protein with peptidoglycan-binding domain
LISDGLFGSETQKKVMEWQMQNGLKVDGLFGRESVKKAGLDD